MKIVGIDCATDDAKIYVALGSIVNGRLELQDVVLCGRGRSASSTIVAWLDGTNTTGGLLAIDAPLGWPKPLAEALRPHSAGALLQVDANEMFRRATDMFITLVAHRIRSKGYKKSKQNSERREIVAALRTRILIRESITDLSDNADRLDAAVCVLAGADFLAGRAMGPTNLPLATQEDWIWAARREDQ